MNRPRRTRFSTFWPQLNQLSFHICSCSCSCSSLFFFGEPDAGKTVIAHFICSGSVAANVNQSSQNFTWEQASGFQVDCRYWQLSNNSWFFLPYIFWPYPYPYPYPLIAFIRQGERSLLWRIKKNARPERPKSCHGSSKSFFFLVIANIPITSVPLHLSIRSASNAENRIILESLV